MAQAVKHGYLQFVSAQIERVISIQKVENFQFSGGHSEIWPAKLLTNHSARNNWEIYKYYLWLIV